MADDQTRLGRAENAFSTRRVAREDMQQIIHDGRTPSPGDLVFVRADKFGQHKNLHLPNGRRRTLFVGDEFIVAYADRYAPSQFEAHVPPDLRPCHLVAAGGVASMALSWHAKLRKPTQITPIGFVANARGQVLNTMDFALPRPEPKGGPRRARIIAFAGTAMNSGKTTCAARLALGLSRSGLRVGYAKVTGTGAAGDPWLLSDAGASPVLDFTDFGHVSTYLIGHDVVEQLLLDMIASLEHANCDVILLELADGLLQRETKALLESDCLRENCDGLVFSAGDAMGAIEGVRRIEAEGHRVLAVAGVLTGAPLQVREAQDCLRVPILGLDELSDSAIARKLVTMSAPSAEKSPRRPRRHAL